MRGPGRGHVGRRVVAIANPLPTETSRGAHDAFIAADVGGTHVRIGLVRGSGDAGTPVHVLEYRKYACAEHAGLGDIVQDFLAHLSLDHGRVTRGVIASAGYALEDGTALNLSDKDQLWVGLKDTFHF